MPNTSFRDCHIEKTWVSLNSIMPNTSFGDCHIEKTWVSLNFIMPNNSMDDELVILGYTGEKNGKIMALPNCFLFGYLRCIVWFANWVNPGVTKYLKNYCVDYSTLILTVTVNIKWASTRAEFLSKLFPRRKFIGGKMESAGKFEIRSKIDVDAGVSWKKAALTGLS